MNIKEIIRLPDPLKNVSVEVKEVIRDFKEKPHVFVRVRINGWHFPERAPEPFLVIGKVISKFVLIDHEGKTADAYFDVKPPAAKSASFGYGKVISWDFNVKLPARFESLDRKKLPDGYIDLVK